MNRLKSAAEAAPSGSPNRRRTRSASSNDRRRVVDIDGWQRPRQIARAEFERLPLRVHTFMRDVRLHDAWLVELPKPRAGITLDAFLRVMDGGACAPPIVRALLNIRFAVGRVFGWDGAHAGGETASFAERLTSADRARTLELPGTRDGPFRLIYRFENEELNEILNWTAHAGALRALVETEHSYRYYFAVYVADVSRLTPAYMALIDPFRKLIVYPLLLRGIASDWQRAWNLTENL